jgi:hypothetical protein
VHILSRRLRARLNTLVKVPVKYVHESELLGNEVHRTREHTRIIQGNYKLGSSIFTVSLTWLKRKVSSSLLNASKIAYEVSPIEWEILFLIYILNGIISK